MSMLLCMDECIFVCSQVYVCVSTCIMYGLDNSGSDLRNLIHLNAVGTNEGLLSASGGDSKCPGHLESPPLALGIPPIIVIALPDNVLVATYALLLSKLVTH